MAIESEDGARWQAGRWVPMLCDQAGPFRPDALVIGVIHADAGEARPKRRLSQGVQDGRGRQVGKIDTRPGAGCRVATPRYQCQSPRAFRENTAVVGCIYTSADQPCQEMLGELDDAHIWFRDGLGRLEGVRKPRFIPANWNLNVIQKRLTGIVAEGKGALVGRIGDVGYVQVNSFQLKPKDFELLEAEFDKLEACKSLIFDVRMNTGGDENYALRLAGRFTDKRRHYTNRMVRDPTRPGIEFHEPIKHWFGPLPGRKPDARRVIVLQGPYCMSSTEGFLQMMRTLPNVTLVGLPSRGSSANPKPFELLPDLQLWISTWRNIDLEGNCTEGVGIKPKLTIDVPPATYANSDPTLDKALALLKDDG